METKNILEQKIESKMSNYSKENIDIAYRSYNPEYVEWCINNPRYTDSPFMVSGMTLLLIWDILETGKNGE